MSQQLFKYQTLSIITRGIVTILGVIQGIIIVRILSPEDYGLIGIVLAVGGLVGVIEHFGLATGSIREISITRTLEEASKVMFTALGVRLVIVLPLAVGLFIASDYISNNIYNHPEISFPLKIFSLIMILQSVQDIFASTLSGLQKFNQLFLFQITSAVINLLVFVVLVKYKGFIGYFYAMLLLALFLLLILITINFNLFNKKFILPTIREFKQIFKNIFNIGLTTWILKILYMFWQKGGILIAGLFLLPKELGYINFAIFVGLKITFIPDSISGINLSVMSKKYNEDVEIFKKEFKDNFYKVFSLLFLVSTIAIFYSKEIIILLVGQKYAPSFPLIPFYIFSCLLYSLINLIGASVIVPTLMLKEAIFYYLVLCGVSFFAIWLFLVIGFGVLGVANGTLLGVIFAIILQNLFIYKKIKLQIFDAKLGLLFLSLVPLVIVYLLSFNQIIKGIFFLCSLYLYFSLNKRLGILNWKKIFKLELVYRNFNIRG